jgi:hypothetical protein
MYDTEWRKIYWVWSHDSKTGRNNRCLAMALGCNSYQKIRLPTSSKQFHKHPLPKSVFQRWYLSKTWRVCTSNSIWSFVLYLSQMERATWQGASGCGMRRQRAIVLLEGRIRRGPSLQLSFLQVEKSNEPKATSKQVSSEDQAILWSSCLCEDNLDGHEIRLLLCFLSVFLVSIGTQNSTPSSCRSTYHLWSSCLWHHA